MIIRIAESKLKSLADGFPVLSVTGPRQSGKSTLVRSTFADYEYLSLEDLDIRQEAIEDPRGFLNRRPKNGFILDEVQNAPDLFSYIQSFADNATQMGKIVLTGSQNFLLYEKISQTLAGRIGWIELLPFSYKEIVDHDVSLSEILYNGLYPPIYDRKLEPSDWYPRYLQTYVDRDVRLIKNITNLSLFQRFLKLCAGRLGQLLNYNSLAMDCGIDVKTAQSWMSVLEISHIVTLLKPHHQNFNKRLVKQSKLYFVDTGLASSLLGIESAKQLETHSMRGSLFENFIYLEFLKERYNRGKAGNIYFWRNHIGQEIDLILENGNALTPIEIKSGETISKDMFKNLKYFNELASAVSNNPMLIYGGDRDAEMYDCKVRSWKSL